MSAEVFVKDQVSDWHWARDADGQCQSGNSGDGDSCGDGMICNGGRGDGDWWYMKAVKAGGALSFAMGHSMALSFATLNS